MYKINVYYSVSIVCLFYHSNIIFTFLVFLMPHLMLFVYIMLVYCAINFLIALFHNTFSFHALWLGINKGMLPVKIVCSNNAHFVPVKFHGDHRTVRKTRINLATLNDRQTHTHTQWCLSVCLRHTHLQKGILLL